MHLECQWNPPHIPRPCALQTKHLFSKELVQLEYIYIYIPSPLVVILVWVGGRQTYPMVTLWYPSMVWWEINFPFCRVSKKLRGSRDFWISLTTFLYFIFYYFLFLVPQGVSTVSRGKEFSHMGFPLRSQMPLPLSNCFTWCCYVVISVVCCLFVECNYVFWKLINWHYF